MEPISSLVAAGLSTALGKIVAGAAVAAVSVAGVDAANIADVPGFEDEPKTVVVAEETPQDADEAKELADEKSGDEEIESEEIEEPETGEEEPGEDLDEDSEGAGESQGIGEDVSTMAQEGDPGVDGHTVADMARDRDQVPDHAGAPEEPGSQAPAEPGSQATDVRQDDSTEDETTDDEVAEEQAPEAPAAEADENRPAGAGSQADTAGRP